MKTPAASSKSELSRLFYLILLYITGALIVCLAVGTIYGMVRSSASQPLIILGRSGQTVVSETAALTGGTNVFSGLGRLRIPLANSSTLIISIAFPYSGDDAAFAEELAAKIDNFRNLASGYFSTLPVESIIKFDEDAAKKELLKRLNENLRLGRISELYFSDFLIIN